MTSQKKPVLFGDMSQQGEGGHHHFLTFFKREVGTKERSEGVRKYLILPQNNPKKSDFEEKIDFFLQL